MSDDSRSPEETQYICRKFDRVRYLRGPQRGLCANRNHAVRACTGDYIALMDDDAILLPDFIRVGRGLIHEADGRTLFTGEVLEYGSQYASRNPSFWGHFTCLPTERYETINLNCNLFPRAAFAAAQFDEHIRYGYEDMDLCAHLLSLGYQIHFVSELINEHRPPKKTEAVRTQERRLAEEARFYTSLRRYTLWQKNKAKAMAYIILAPLHRIGFDVKMKDWADIPHSFRDMKSALQALRA